MCSAVLLLYLRMAVYLTFPVHEQWWETPRADAMSFLVDASTWIPEKYVILLSVMEITAAIQSMLQSRRYLKESINV